MTNKQRIISLIGSFVFVAIVVFIPFESYFFRYDTIEEAIMATPNWRDGEIFGILEDNGVALVVYRERPRTYRRRVVFRDERGWIFPHRMIDLDRPNLISHLHYNGYSIAASQRDKIAIVIRMSPFRRREPDGTRTLLYDPNTIQETVKDNIGSNFQFEIIDGAPIWFLVLDEIPEEYILILDGEELRLN